MVCSKKCEIKNALILDNLELENKLLKLKINNFQAIYINKK
jgi:hypothetical protein